MPSFYQNQAPLNQFIENVRKIPGAVQSSKGSGPPIFNDWKSRSLSLDGWLDFSLGAKDFVHESEIEYEHPARKEKYGEMLNEVETRGIEALAWYRSFHYDDSDWGIFIPESSLYFLADVVFSGTSLEDGVGGLDHARDASAEHLHKAWLLLWAHEVFHFATDLAIARWETVLQRPLWAFDLFRKRQEQVNYWLYEEQAANAYMLRHLRERWSEVEMDRVEAFTRRQPPGYREAMEAVPDEWFFPLLEELMRSKVGILGIRAVKDLMAGALSAASFLDIDDDSIAKFRCPVHLVLDAGSVRRPHVVDRIIAPIPVIEESKLFMKKLGRMHSDYRARWARKKAGLADRIPPHPEFEKFSDGPPPVFSIRLSRSARAHLRRRASDGAWIAFDVGEHKAMGHG